MKREGDGKTPLGVWPIRELLFRADRLQPPKTFLPMQALSPEDGWCDAPMDPGYNQKVRHPYPASAERLWRDDRLYDLLVVLGYNDDPVLRGRGSAIFLHVAGEAYAPTEGCIALAPADLLELLAEARPGDSLEGRAD